MIALYLTFCVIGADPAKCSTLRADDPYETYEACDLKGGEMVTSSGLEAILAAQGLRLDDWACAPDGRELRG